MGRFISVIVLVAISISIPGALAQQPPDDEMPGLLSQTPVTLPPGVDAQTDNPLCSVRRMNDGVGLVADEATSGFAKTYPGVAVSAPIVGSLAYTLVAQSQDWSGQPGDDIATARAPGGYASCVVIAIPLNGIRITELWVSMFEESAFEHGQAQPSAGHCTQWDSYSGWFKCEGIGSAAFTSVHTPQFLVVTLKNWSGKRTRGALVSVFGYEISSGGPGRRAQEKHDQPGSGPPIASNIEVRPMQ